MRSAFTVVALLFSANVAVAQTPPRAPRPVRQPAPAPAPVAAPSPAASAAAAMSADYAARASDYYARASAMAYAPSAYRPDAFMQEWTQRDPADSLYRVAYEAMNRGDWRQSADLFAQVQEKFPRSSRLISAAYYEAFANYRIGSPESLRSSLKILTEKTKGATQSSTQAEIASLTTRVRGALAARGDRDAQNQLASDAQRGKACDREDIQVRTEALSALAQADMSSATPMLMRVLNRKDECSLELRRRALSILLRSGDTAATNAAIVVARNSEENMSLRGDAISYLSRLPGDNAISTLQDLLRTSEDANIQRAAVRSLSRSDNLRARQAVRALIERNDVNEQLRAEAISSMDTERSSSDDGAYLRSLYPKLQGERLRMTAISTIGRMGGDDNERFLLTLARSTSEPSEIRASAIRRLTKVPTVSIAEWQRLYDGAESRSIRSQIISVYSQRQEPEAVERLIDIVKNGTDPSLRSSAINALRLKDDARARKLLQDMIDKEGR